MSAVLPQPSEPLIDLRTGRVTELWYRYFSQGNLSLNSTALADAVADLESALTPATGTCRLVRTDVETITLNRGIVPLRIGGVWSTKVISTPVTIDNSGLSNSTVYYAYLFDDAGTPTLELSATGPATNSDFGVRVKSGDATRSLVGRVYTDSSGEFPTAGNIASVVSHYSRLHYLSLEQVLFGSIGGLGYSVPDLGAGFTFLTGTTASTFPSWVTPNTAFVTRANFRVIVTSSTSAHAIELVHFDNGPTNIVQIAEINPAGTGSPENLGTLVTTELRALFNGIVLKNIGFRVSKNTGSMTLFKVSLELVLNTNPDIT